jgi:hypothetical protein
MATGGDGDDAFHIQSAPSDLVLDGSTGTEVATITDYNPADDSLTIDYNAADYAVPPVVTVNDFADNTGADIYLDGVLVASVTGAQGIAAGSVSVQPDYHLDNGLSWLPAV